MSEPIRKTYLGDGAYAAFDGYALILTTEDGIRETNRIVLEPEVWRFLSEFVQTVEDAEVERDTGAG